MAWRLQFKLAEVVGTLKGSEALGRRGSVACSPGSGYVLTNSIAARELIVTESEHDQQAK